MKSEPVLISGAVQLLVILAAAFGLDLTEEQLGAFVAVILAIGVFVARRFAWSPRSVEKVTGVPAGVAEERLKL